MGLRRAALGLLLAVAAGGPAVGQEDICGTHVVAPGETLAEIAVEVYGRAGAAGLIFEANRDRLPGPDLIRPGQELRLPCDPQGETGKAPETAPAPEQDGPAQAPDPAAAEAAPAPDARPIPEAPEAPPETPAPERAPAAAFAPAATSAEVLTVAALADAAPALERLQAVLSGGAPDRPLSVTPGGLEDLDPAGPALLAAPLPGPGCPALERLDVEAAALCVRLDWSAPLVREQVIWFVAGDGALLDAQDPDALRGHRICRPEGLPVGDLAAAGLLAPRAVRLSPETAEDCLRMVLSGEADAAALPAGGARAAKAALGAEGERLREVPALSGEITWHAVARKNSARGRAALARLDQALADDR